MPQPIFRFETDVSGDGMVTVKLPLPPGTSVEIAVLALDGGGSCDPLDAASAQVEQLRGELKELRKENRQLKKSLGALMCKDLPVNMDLTPEDGVSEPSLLELIDELRKST